MSGKLDITPRRGLYRPEIVRAVLSGHSILGIAFAAILYLVCLTGSLSVFAQDLERWEQPDAPVLATVSDAAVARAVAMVAPRLGAGDPLYVQLPSSDMPRLTLTTHHGEEGHNWLADAGGGIIGEARSPWTDFLTALHIQLHLPDSWGRFIVGLAGVALVSSLIWGVLSHPRIVRDAFHLRLGGARRLQEADIHNRIGVWALPFHLAVSLTGALLGSARSSSASSLCCCSGATPAKSMLCCLRPNRRSTRGRRRCPIWQRSWLPRACERQRQRPEC